MGLRWGFEGIPLSFPLFLPPPLLASPPHYSDAAAPGQFTSIPRPAFGPSNN